MGAHARRGRFFDLGHFTRGCTEHLILATRGTTKALLKNKATPNEAAADDYLQDGVNGLLFESGDVHALRDTLRRAMTEDLGALRGAGRAMVERRFTWARTSCRRASNSMRSLSTSEASVRTAARSWRP